MSAVATENPGTLLSQPIVFVTSYEEAAEVVRQRHEFDEFFVIGDNSSKPSSNVSVAFKERNVRLFRIRPSGVWNVLLRAVGDVEVARHSGQYPDATSLMFISLIPAADIAAALKRHRAIAHISSREMYWLDTLKFGEEYDDIIELTLRSMPSVPAPVMYCNLTVEQIFDLSGFEFTRFARPLHCVTSVTKMLEASPFYTSDHFGMTYDIAGKKKKARAA